MKKFTFLNNKRTTNISDTVLYDSNESQGPSELFDIYWGIYEFLQAIRNTDAYEIGRMYHTIDSNSEELKFMVKNTYITSNPFSFEREIFVYVLFNQEHNVFSLIFKTNDTFSNISNVRINLESDINNIRLFD